MRGRKPDLTLVRGDDRASLDRCPSAPRWLSKWAQAEWRRSAHRLHQRKLLTSEALATLEHYCLAVGTVRECEQTLQREGRTISTDGKIGTHPAFHIQAAVIREARLLAAELALTPHRQGTQAPSRRRRKTDEDGWDSELLA